MTSHGRCTITQAVQICKISEGAWRGGGRTLIPRGARVLICPEVCSLTHTHTLMHNSFTDCCGWCSPTHIFGRMGKCVGRAGSNIFWQHFMWCPHNWIYSAFILWWFHASISWHWFVVLKRAVQILQLQRSRWKHSWADAQQSWPKWCGGAGKPVLQFRPNMQCLQHTSKRQERCDRGLSSSSCLGRDQMQRHISEILWWAVFTVTMYRGEDNFLLSCNILAWFECILVQHISRPVDMVVKPHITILQPHTSKTQVSSRVGIFMGAILARWCWAAGTQHFVCATTHQCASCVNKRLSLGCKFNFSVRIRV